VLQNDVQAPAGLARIPPHVGDLAAARRRLNGADGESAPHEKALQHPIDAFHAVSAANFVSFAVRDLRGGDRRRRRLRPAS